MGIEQRATRNRIFFGHELLHRHASEFGIGVEPCAILERELLRLDDEMQMLGAAPAQCAEIEAFESALEASLRVHWADADRGTHDRDRAVPRLASGEA